MRGAISLGRILGIRIFVHFTFIFIFIWVAFMGYKDGYTTSKILFECLLVLTVFVCVVMHEFGHALAAKRYGIETKQILLLPIGGVAQLERMPENPRQELIVALAGPLVNVIIASVLLPVVISLYSFDQMLDESFIGSNFLGRLLLVNIGLLVFNLVPAFPMDGGRVLRALLGFWLSYPKATLIAVRVGQLMAIGFAVMGIYFDFFWIILIGIFVFFGAETEYRMVSRRAPLGGLKVRDALLNRFTTLHPTDTLSYALNRLMANPAKDYLVVENETVTGLLSRQRLIEAYGAEGGEQMVGHVMEKAFPFLEAEQPLDVAVDTLQSNNYGILPVIDANGWIGAVNLDTIRELLLARRPGMQPGGAEAS